MNQRVHIANEEKLGKNSNFEALDKEKIVQCDGGCSTTEDDLFRRIVPEFSCK
jgi:hypothetical protein